jgi:hypothetical protein
MRPRGREMARPQMTDRQSESPSEVHLCRGPIHGEHRIRAGNGGFTLLETALALVIIMVGVVAMIEAQRTFIRSNSWSSHEATATHLANELRERMRTLPRHDPVTGLTLGQDQHGNTVLIGLGPEPGEVTVDDFDDVDDYDGLTFGGGGQFDGPIDAFGRVIPEVDAAGNIRLDALGNPIPLQGWSQSVSVEKVDPYDFADPVGWMDFELPTANFPGRAVDRYPLRVVVRVFYQGPLEPEPGEVTRMSWIVPVE